MINRVGTIWGDDAAGRLRPVAIHRVGDRFKLSNDDRHVHLESDDIDAAVEAATTHFGLRDARFGPSRLPVRDSADERRGTHPSYGWR